jgi:hypothetical protein
VALALNDKWVLRILFHRKKLPVPIAPFDRFQRSNGAFSVGNIWRLWLMKWHYSMVFAHLFELRMRRVYGLG